MIKKILYGIILGTLMMAVLTGCGKKDNEDKADKSETTTTQAEVADIDVAAQTIVDTLQAEGDFSETLAAVDNNMALSRLYVLDSAKIEEACFYTSSGATAEEIVVIKVNDEAYMETVKGAFDARIADQTEAFKDYVPEEVPKLEDAVIYTNGCYAILCVSGDSSKIDSSIANIFN